jgi:hypothetical protein
VLVKKNASAAAEGLRSLQAALDDLTPLYRAALLKPLDTPFRAARNLDALSARADMYAMGFKRFENGGAPKMLEFHMLVSGLASAFEEAAIRSQRKMVVCRRSCRHAIAASITACGASPCM